MSQIVKRLVGWASRPRRAAVPAGEPDDGNPDSSFKELVKGTVYELYAPSDSDPAVDVVFFHGLQLGDGSLAWRKTWESEIDGRKVCWPAELLPADLPGARVLTLCYDTAARSLPDQGRFDVEDLGTFAFSALRQAGVGERPLLLVGHSLGGLVLKQVLLHVDERAGKAANPAEKTAAKTFLGNVLGMAFYSTPHAGARLADYANALMSGVLRAVATPGPVMPYLCTLSKKAFRVNAPFQDLRRREGWITLGFCEMQATKAGPFNAVVVEQASGLQDMDARELINADHGGVCKPTSATDLPYSVLKSYIEERLRERDEVQMSQLLEAATLVNLL